MSADRSSGASDRDLRGRHATDYRRPCSVATQIGIARRGRRLPFLSRQNGRVHRGGFTRDRAEAFFFGAFTQSAPAIKLSRVFPRSTRRHPAPFLWLEYAVVHVTRASCVPATPCVIHGFISLQVCPTSPVIIQQGPAAHARFRSPVPNNTPDNLQAEREECLTSLVEMRCQIRSAGVRPSCGFTSKPLPRGEARLGYAALVTAPRRAPGHRRSTAPR